MMEEVKQELCHLVPGSFPKVNLFGNIAKVAAFAAAAMPQRQLQLRASSNLQTKIGAGSEPSPPQSRQTSAMGNKSQFIKLVKTS